MNGSVQIRTIAPSENDPRQPFQRTLGRADAEKARTVRHLVEQLSAGDTAAGDKVLDMAAAGDEEARATIRRLIAEGARNHRPPSLKAEKKAYRERLKSTAEALVIHGTVQESAVAELLCRSHSSNARPSGRSGLRCRSVHGKEGLVRAVDAAGPAGEEAVQDLLHEAASLGECEIVQALFLQAYFYRQLQGKDGEAENVLTSARDIAGSCQACQAGLLWRRADLRGFQGRYSEGLEDADGAVHSHRELGGPDHDLDGVGEAKSVSIRGMLRCEQGDLHGSIADFGLVLQMLSPRRTPDLFAYGVLNLAFPLRKSGTEGREQAVRLIAGARRKFHGVLNSSLPRALLDWHESVLKLSMGYRYRYRWMNLLLRAMRDFARMGMGAQAMAVMADLARVEFKDRAAIRALFATPELQLVILDSRFREPLHFLVEAAKERTFRAFDRLDQSISRLRRVAEESPVVLPCFVS